MQQPFTLAHLSDPHIAPVPPVPLRYLNAKRALGLLNWYRKRRCVHRMSRLSALIADLKAQQPDHIALTGDLVNLGLPDEHRHAALWLTKFAGPADISLIPGNHDIYSAIGDDPGTLRWQAYMSSTLPGTDVPPTGSAFPYLRTSGRIAIVGLCSAVETPPFIAGGRLGKAQLGKAAELLARLGGEGHCRVVLIHHPPLPGQAKPRSALEDAGDMAEMLRQAGAELVLHGHNHQAERTVVERPGLPDIPVVGVASASSAETEPNRRAQYNLYRMTSAANGWRIEMSTRGMDDDGCSVVALGEAVLRAS